MKILLSRKHPIKKHIYAIVTGTYVGEMWTIIKEDDENYYFISVPKLVNRTTPKEKFEFGIKHGIIDHVEKLPSKIWKILQAQFNSNEKLNYRRQQSDSQSLLDQQEHETD